jgi:hypothetical protein
MKRLAILFVVAVLLLGSTGCQQSRAELQPTAYHSDKDIYIVFKGAVFTKVTALLPVRVLGEVAFKLQEGTHSSITDVSQAEIDHYYIWVCLAEDCIPVDPFTYSN